ALDLSAVQCVVLSACESGIGRPSSGEGVFGLRRAFQVAGAATLVASLCPVRDAAAFAWMSSFYESLSRGRSPARAGIDASRALRSASRRSGGESHPADWVGFIVVGGE